MGKLPNVRVCINYGFYLAPTGATGSEAIVYLPAYDDYVRNHYQRKGFVLLSECEGDSAATANPLVIRPPSDATIRAMIRTLKDRLPEEMAKINGLERQVKEDIKDELLEPKERRVWRGKLRGLVRLRKELEGGIPSFAEAKAFFLREYRIRISLAQSQDVRRSLAMYAHEQEVSASLALLEAQTVPGEEPEEVVASA